MLGESVVSLALPSIGKTLQVPFASLQWVVDGYNLTLSAFILLGGSLGDLLGLRRVYLWSTCDFPGAVASLCVRLERPDADPVSCAAWRRRRAAHARQSRRLNAQLPKDPAQPRCRLLDGCNLDYAGTWPAGGRLSRRSVFVACHLPLQCPARPYRNRIGARCAEGNADTPQHAHRLGGRRPCVPVSGRAHLRAHRGSSEWLASHHHRSSCGGCCVFCCLCLVGEPRPVIRLSISRSFATELFRHQRRNASAICGIRRVWVSVFLFIPNPPPAILPPLRERRSCPSPSCWRCCRARWGAIPHASAPAGSWAWDPSFVPRVCCYSCL